MRNLQRNAGLVSFTLGERPVTFWAVKGVHGLEEGEWIRALVRRKPALAIIDVVVIQHGVTGRLHYTGPRLSPLIVIVAAALLVVAARGPLAWLGLLMSLPVFTAVAVFGLQQLQAVRAFHVEWQRENRMGGVAPASSMPHADIETPLDLPRPDGSSLEQSILNFTHDAIIMWELNGAGIVYWNAAAEVLYGYPRSAALGRVTHHLLQTRLAGGVGELEERLARFGVWVGELEHKRIDGSVVHVDARLSIVARSQRPWLVLEVNRDITDNKKAEQEREELRQRLAQVLRTNVPPEA